MTTRLGLIIVAVVAAILAAPLAAQAACSVNVGGTLYVDTDCDGLRDISDNCPLRPNGDCDADELNCDVDGNGLLTDEELAAGEQWDWDHDGMGDACDDADNDTVDDYVDNCREDFNTDQDPDACLDTDGDGVMDPVDNCPMNINQTQNNRDNDLFGDACDNCPFTANDDQNPLACPAAERGAIPDPDEDTTPEPEPRNGGGFTSLPIHAEGSGGCSLAADAAAQPWAMLMMLAAGMVVAVRRKGRG